MIQISNPMWLWGLGGLLIPIAIHLLSRKEGKIVNIGSLRHFQESDTARFSSIKINEILLLFVRCLLITLLVLILSGLDFTTNTLSNARWVVIEKGIENDKNIKSLLDSLNAEGYETHYLSQDFPTRPEGVARSEKNYWSLADQLKSKFNHDIIVISYNYLSGFKGKRLHQADHIRWMAQEPEGASILVKTVKTSNDSIWIRAGSTSSEGTILKTLKVKYQGQKHYSLQDLQDSVIVENPDTISISIFSDDQFSHDLKIIRASLNSIQTISPYPIAVTYKNVSGYNRENTDWIIWLSEVKFKDASKQPSIVYAACSGDNQPIFATGAKSQLFCRGTENASWVLTKRLSTEIVLLENFNVSLAEIILSQKKTNIDQKEKRTLSSEIMWSPIPKGNSNLISKKSTASNIYLIVGLFVVLLIERGLSFKRSQ